MLSSEKTPSCQAMITAKSENLYSSQNTDAGAGKKENPSEGAKEEERAKGKARQRERTKRKHESAPARGEAYVPGCRTLSARAVVDIRKRAHTGSKLIVLGNARRDKRRPALGLCGMLSVACSILFSSQQMFSARKHTTIPGLNTRWFDQL